MEETIACIALIILGLTGIYPFLINLSRTIDSSDWITTEAEMIGVGVVTNIDHYLSDFPTGMDVLSYVPSIRYKYTINGKSFIGSRVSFIDTIPAISADFVKRKLKKYKHVRTVTVFVSPTDPNESVIERGIQFDSYLSCCFGVLLSLLGVAMLANIYS